MTVLPPPTYTSCGHTELNDRQYILQSIHTISSFKAGKEGFVHGSNFYTGIYIHYWQMLPESAFPEFAKLSRKHGHRPGMLLTIQPLASSPCQLFMSKG